MRDVITAWVTWSDLLLPAVPSGAPLNVLARALSADTVLIEWSPPRQPNGNLLVCTVYTVVHRNVPLLRGFLQFLYQWKWELMFYSGVTKFVQLYHNYMSPHYLIKLRPHKTAHFKSVVTVFHYSTEERIGVWDKWAFYKTCSVCPPC